MTTQLAKRQTTAQPTGSQFSTTRLGSTVLGNTILGSTVRAILSDSRQEAARYVDEVVVPREAGE